LRGAADRLGFGELADAGVEVAEKLFGVSVDGVASGIVEVGGFW
jgi:hypothetical protein